MRVMSKEPGKCWKVAEIENTLEALQQGVGGKLEAVTLASDACVLCNEEGRLLGTTPGTKARQVVKNHGVQQIGEAPVEQHSRKPAEVRERIVRLLGDVPRIELFARERVPGWDAWGNEV